MSGATDGDVDRALAAMGAVPLKYHSFGVATVRPPGSQPAPQMSGQMAGPGIDQGRAPHAAAAVFPLLGFALPEAFQVDVEPQWPPGTFGGMQQNGETFPGAAVARPAAPAPMPPQPMMFQSAPAQPVPTQPLSNQSFQAQPYSPQPYSPQPLSTPSFTGQPVAQPPLTASRQPEAEPAAYSPFSLPPWLEPSAPPAAPASRPPAVVAEPLHNPIAPPEPVAQPWFAPPPPPPTPLPTGDRAGMFTLPPWLEPLPSAIPPASHPVPLAPVAVPATSHPSVAAPATPPDDSDRTMRFTPPQSGFSPTPAGALPPWLETLPAAASPVAAPPVAPPPSAPVQGAGWLERAMVNPPQSPPIHAVPPPVETAIWHDPGPPAAPVQRGSEPLPGWQQLPHEQPVLSREPVAPPPRDEPVSPAMVPLDLPVASAAETPARKPLADMFRALRARPTPPDHAAGDGHPRSF